MSSDKPEDEFGAPEGAPPEVVVEQEEAHAVRAMVFAGQTADVGLDGLFNTFRMGSRWANLEEGEPVLCMVDAVEGEHYVPLPRPATVQRVASGSLSEMLQLHTGLNHAGLQGLHSSDQRDMLKAILEKCYGETFDGQEDCTVIYLIRDAA